jgi:hypothetical protein
MENPKNISIDNNIAIWDMKIDGDIAGTYTGIFKFRCFLSPTQLISAGKEYRNMLGEHHITAPEYEANLAYALTQLKYRVISAPPFWSSTLQNSILEGDIADVNVILAVLDAAMESEFLYREELKTKKEKALEVSKKIAESLLNQGK